nr:nucleotide-binding alpha-beta plait domain-containing protein [Tanacetum cinerariifolium]
MGSFRSKEDDVSRISIFIFITNFPDSFSAKDLFHSCKQYGHVVDSFIPTKRAKDGKRFGFVRFINVFNVERLVNNLCTIWVGRLKFHANVARFKIEFMKGSGNADKMENVSKPNGPHKEVGKSVIGKSFMSVVQDSKLAKEMESSPAIARASEVPGWTPEFSEEEEEDNLSVEGNNDGKPNVHEVYRENERGDNLFVNLEVGKDNSDSVKKNSESTCSVRFKESEMPRTGSSILSLMEDVVK